MKTRVDAGGTYILRGVLAPDDTLVGAAGTRHAPKGAVITVRTVASNAGTIALAGGPSVTGGDFLSGAALRVGGTLTNTGLIALQGGDLASNGAGAVTGAHLLDDGTLLNSGRVLVGGAKDGSVGTQTGTGAILRDNGVLTNTGTLLVIGEASYAAGAPAPEGGTVVVAGVLTNSGLIGLDGAPHAQRGYPGAGGVLKVLETGALANDGILLIDGNGPQAHDGAGGTLFDRGVIVNTGLIQLGSTGRFTSAEGGALLTIASTGTLTNAGLLDANDGYHAYGVGGIVDAGVLSNSGFLVLSGLYGGTTLGVTGSLDNSGVITLYGGPGPDYSGGGGGSGATLNNDGVFVNSGTLIVQPGGPTNSRLGPGSPAVVQDQGTLTNTGEILIEGGQYSFYYFGQSIGGVLDVTGVLTNLGTLIAGAGVDQPGNDIFSRGSIAVSGTLTNAGLLALQGGSYVEGGQLIDSGTVDNTGTLVIGGSPYGNAASLTVTATGTLMNSGLILGSGTIVNQGVIAAAGTGTIQGDLINDGGVTLGAGAALSVGGSVAASPGSTGAFYLAAASVLTLQDGLGRGERVAFAGSNATLALADPRDFQGALVDLSAQATIDFLKLDVIGLHATSSTLLVEIGGGGTIDLALAAALPDRAVLRLGSDGQGGTDLHIAAGVGAAAMVSFAIAPHAIA